MKCVNVSGSTGELSVGIGTKSEHLLDTTAPLQDMKLIIFKTHWKHRPSNMVFRVLHIAGSVYVPVQERA
jgi:hypothetical protein